MIEDKGKFIEHINDNDQILAMRKVLDKIERSTQNHSIESTDFLDPYQCRLSYSILNRFQEIDYYEEGGYEGAERKSIIIYPFYLDKSAVENPIGAIKIIRKSTFNALDHRDYLGAILSLGIKREKMGDILVHEDLAYLVVHKEIIDYLLINLTRIGKEEVDVREIELEAVVKGEVAYKEIATTIASLRLDSLVSSAINVSRSASSSTINGGKVKLNWQPILQPSREVMEGDMLSIRGYGRYELFKILGSSKKGRTRILIKKYI